MYYGWLIVVHQAEHRGRPCVGIQCRWSFESNIMVKANVTSLWSWYMTGGPVYPPRPEKWLSQLGWWLATQYFWENNIGHCYIALGYQSIDDIMSLIGLVAINVIFPLNMSQCITGWWASIPRPEKWRSQLGWWMQPNVNGKITLMATKPQTSLYIYIQAMDS